ncbi:MAG: hypothetical protein ABR956_00025 [Terracidiphilus sp.]|jgi:hypothetical protein
MRETDDLDLLLDSALSSYADPGPQTGLERRVLARVLGAHAVAEIAPAPRRRWLLGAFALPATAGLLLLVLSLPRATRPPSHPVLGSGQSQTSQIASAHANWQPAQRSKAPLLHVPPRAVVFAIGSAPLPKLDVFPTPQPLTPEEQAAAISTFQIPATEFRAVIVAQKQEDAPLSIAAIDIQPLEPPDIVGN